MTKRICAMLLAFTMTCSMGVTGFAESAVTEDSAADTTVSEVTSTDTDTDTDSVAEEAVTDTESAAEEVATESESADSDDEANSSTDSSTEEDKDVNSYNSTTSLNETSGDYEYYFVGGYDSEGNWVEEDAKICISGYTGSATSLKIPSEIDGKEVTQIGSGAFYGNSKLKSVTIPNTVTDIEESAFSNCSKLKTVNIPDSVTYVGDAFDGTAIVDNQTTTVKYIDNWAVESDISAKTIKIKDGIVGLSGGMFNSEDTWIEDEADPVTNYPKLTTLTIPDSVSYLCCGFGECTSLKNVTIGKSIKTIGSYTFYNSKSLESVTFSEGLETLEVGAFYGCSALKSVNIPKSVKSYGKASEYAYGGAVFAWCTSLETITVDEDNPYYTSIDGVVYNKKKTKLIECAEGKSSVTIEKTVKTIRTNAFCGCTKISSLKIPSSVTTIGSWAFWGCDSLKRVTIPKTVKKIGDAAFGLSNGGAAPENGDATYFTKILLKCYSGTAGEKYAKSESGINYINIDKKPDTPKIKKANKSKTAVKLFIPMERGITGYKIQQYNTKTKKWKTIDKVSILYTYSDNDHTYWYYYDPLRYKITGLKKGTTYKFRVQAYTTVSSKKVLKSSWSKAFSVTTKK